MRKLKLPGRDVTRPRLNENDVELIREEGIAGLRDHAEMIVSETLGDPEIDKEVPMAGNPVYKAMHACNAASREQLEMSHRIPADKELNKADIASVVDLLARWIAREYNFFMEEKDRKQRNLADFSEEAFRA